MGARARGFVAANGGVALGSLSLSATEIRIGVPVVITIGGALVDSVLTATGLPTGLTLNSAARTITGTPTVISRFPLDLTETGAGRAGSPKRTKFGIAVTAAPTVIPAPAKLLTDQGLAAANSTIGVIPQAPPLLDTARRSFIATNGDTAGFKTAVGSPQAKSTSFHIMRDDLDGQIEVEFANFYVASATSVEAGPGAPASIAASIEYPPYSGNRIQLLDASGSATGTIPDGGRLSMFATVSGFKRGGPFLVRQFRTCAAGNVYGPGASLATQLGECAQFGTAQVDHTMGGAEPTDFVNGAMRPIAIYGMTRRRTLACITDSIFWGAGDYPDDLTGDIGGYARALGPIMAYSKLGVPGDSAAEFVASHANRLAVALAASDIGIGLGRNDTGGGRTNAQIQADLLTIAGYFPASTNFYLATVPPKLETSTDNAATLAGQTVENSKAAIDTLNDWMRSRPAPFKTVIDANAALSSSYKSGKYAVDPGAIPFWMVNNDGFFIHPSTRGHKRIAALIKPI